jgi:phospholipid/cholesterol/gamma-HCH transport system permease protein
MERFAAFEVTEGKEQAADVALSGPWLVSTIGAVEADFDALDEHARRFDLSGITEIDSAGAWLIHRTAERRGAQVTGGSKRAQRLIEAVGGQTSDVDIRAPREAVVTRVTERIGELAYKGQRGFVGVIGFLGALLLAFANLARHPRTFPMKAFVRQLELVGVSALPIIGLMSFLIGIVIAQQGAVQLAQFGAETLTVNLVGRITLRELGVLMTAIMVAGRSGSAFAAQIGTMKLTEEIDAMRTIGISPMEALVIPRILACVFMMFVLGFYSMVMAIVGGAVVGDLVLGIPFLTFIARIQEVVPLYDLWVGLIKAPVFGLIVALAGCYHGMQVKGNSEEVGLRTTMAVVSAIFAVIVLDAFFAVFFTSIGWG